VVPVLFMVAFRVATRYCPAWHVNAAVVFWLAFSCMGRLGWLGSWLGNTL